MFVTIKEGKNNNINNLLASSHTHAKAFLCAAIREREAKRKTNGKRKQYNEIY